MTAETPRPQLSWGNHRLLKHFQQTGDDRAFEILANRFERLFFKVARRYYLPPQGWDSTEDLKQDMRIRFLAVCREAGAGKFRQDFFAFVRLVAKRSAIGSLRSYHTRKNEVLNQATSLDSNEKAVRITKDDTIEPLKEVVPTRNPNDQPVVALEIDAGIEQIFHAIERDLTPIEKAAVYGLILGHTYEETGKLYGYTEEQIDNALQRARKRLNHSLAHIIHKPKRRKV